MVALATFVVSLVVLGRFDQGDAGFQMVEHATWVKDVGLQYLVGIDGISIWMVLLTTFLFPVAVLASWKIDKDVRLYMGAMLALETAVLGSFVSLDLLLFFLFFEAILVPMYLLIGGWGGERRVYAAVKFFLYTMAGSAFLLVARSSSCTRARARFWAERTPSTCASSVQVRRGAPAGDRPVALPRRSSWRSR